MNNLLIVSILVIFASTNGFLSEELVQSCANYELQPHPTNCSEFTLKCSGDEPFPMFCPPGLEFNPKINACDWPENAKCFHKAASTPLECENYKKYPYPYDCTKFYYCIDYKLKLDDCSEKLFFNKVVGLCDLTSNVACEAPAACDEYSRHAHPYDCNKYYKCFANKMVENECSAGFHFDKINERCDFAENVECKVSFPEPEPPVIEEPNCVDYEKYPVPHDCSKFYSCLRGQLYENDCPHPLLFNDEVKACDEEATANCIATTTTELIPTTLPVTTTTEKICDDYTQYPYPLDCNLFYFCLGNKLHLMQCPIELEFNDDIKWCDYPESANCYVTTIEPTTVSSTEIPCLFGKYCTQTPEITTTTEEITTTTDQPTTTTEEPTTTTEEPITTEEPTTTTEEPTTTTEEPITTEEPTTTTEEPTTTTEEPITTEEPTTTTEEPTTTTEEPITTEEPTTSTPSNTTEEITTTTEEPTTTTEEPTTTTEEATTTTEEPTTTTEEPTTTTAEPTTTTETTTTETSTTEPPTTITETTTIATTEKPTTTTVPTTTTTTTTEAPVTPKPIDCNAGMYHPHPYDCGKFYQCSNGVPIEMKCPAGLHFNTRINVCDWPAAAGCTVN